MTSIADPADSRDEVSGGLNADRNRCLVISGGGLARTLADFLAVASLAFEYQVTWLGPETQRAVLDPSLLQWRLRFAEGDTARALTPPISLSLEDADPKRLRALDFQLAVALHAPRHHGLAKKAGIPQRWGYGGFWRGRRFTHPVQSGPQVRVEQDAWPLLQAMSVPLRPEPLYISDTWIRAGRERLQKAKLSPGDEPIIGLYVGGDQGFGTGSGRDIWPTENFEALLHKLRENQPGRRFVILSGEADLWTSVLLFERTGKIHPVIGPDLTLDGMAAVLAQLQLVVASDSALLQLAAAVGTPTLGLFRRHAERCAPEGDGHRYLQRSRLKKLKVAEVLGVVESLVA